jgi:arylsulfatase A-like enzyme
MKRTVAFYLNLAAPWICVAVYFWSLELRAAMGTDSEPVTVWLADCAAILLTLVFWVMVAVLMLALAVSLIGRERGLGLNRLAASAGIIVVTAMHFVRWLLNWENISSHLDVGLAVLAGATLVLAALAWKQRQTQPSQVNKVLPSLEDCFLFGALPVVIAAIVIVGIRIAGNSNLAPPPSPVVASPTIAAGTVNSRKNLILIISDAMRAQSMSLYGYARQTTPNLDRWSESATVYQDAHINSTSTKPSMTTILTGKHPLSHGRLTKAQPPDRSGENLLRLLRDHGYFVGAVTSNEDASLNLLGFASSLSEKEHTAFEFLTLSWLRQHGIHPTPTGGRMYQSLARFLGFLGYPEKTSYYGHAEDTLRIATEFVRRAKRPFFLVIHLHEPHDPYDAPPPIRGTFSKRSALEADPKFPSGRYGTYDAALQPTVDFYRDQYEESIQYLDQQLGEFLKESARFMENEEFALIFTGDHGESFERGYMNHGDELYESSTHVPLVIRFPKQSAGTRLTGLVQSVDIAPTILSIAEIERPQWMEGRVLHPDLAPETGSVLTVNFKDPIGQTSYPLPTKLAIWARPYKVIVDCESAHTSLYNLASDPQEKIDLSKHSPKVVHDLKSLLKVKLAGQQKGPKIACSL